MATIVRKSRSSVNDEAARLAVVETKIENIEEKLDDLKTGVKDMHDCLDLTRDTLLDTLKEHATENRVNGEKFYAHMDTVQETNSKQHDELLKKVTGLEKEKNKVIMYVMVFLAFAAGTGWLNSTSFPHILKFLGL